MTDRLKSYPGALREMKRDGELWRFTRHRRGPLAQQPGRAGPPPRSSAEPGRCSAFRAFGRRGEPSPASRPWRCWRRDRCVPCLPTTCRRSGPLYTRSSALPPERRRRAGARPHSANATEPASRQGTRRLAIHPGGCGLQPDPVTQAAPGVMAKDAEHRANQQNFTPKRRSPHHLHHSTRGRHTAPPQSDTISAAC